MQSKHADPEVHREHRGHLLRVRIWHLQREILQAASVSVPFLFAMSDALCRGSRSKQDSGIHSCDEYPMNRTSIRVRCRGCGTRSTRKPQRNAKSERAGYLLGFVR